MKIYSPLDPVINKLIDEQASLSSGTYLLTLYVNTNGKSKLQVKKELKSNILSTFKLHKYLTKALGLAHEFIKIVNLKIDNLPSVPNGIALFIHAKTKLNNRSVDDDELKKMVNLIPLPHHTIEKHVVAKTYNLDQLIKQSEISFPSWVISIEHDVGKIYTLYYRNLELIKEFKNKYVTSGQNYIETNRAPTQHTFHGTGQDKYQKSQLDEYQWFWNDVLKWIKAQKPLLEQIDYLVVFYSQPFHAILSDLEQEEVLKSFSINLLLVDKPIADENKLKANSIKLIADDQIMKQHQELKQAREVFGKYTEGWKKVCQAASDHRVETLFISSTATKPGYVYNDGYVSSYPIKGSKKVDDLVPWLVKLVKQSGGQIIMVDSDKLLAFDIGVGAKLRY